MLLSIQYHTSASLSYQARTIGAQIGYNAKGKWWIISGVQLLKSGMQINYAELEMEQGYIKDFTFKQDRKLNYYNVPLLARYQRNKRISFIANAGGYVSILQDAYFSEFIRSVEITDGVVREAHYIRGDASNKKSTTDIVIRNCTHRQT